MLLESVQLTLIRNSTPPPMLKRIGIAGLGKMGLLHAAIFNSLSHSCVVAIADPSDLPRAVLSKFNAAMHLFPSIEQMLDSCPLDAVVIATPVADHVPVALSCALRDIPFFMEKPLAVSAAQAVALVQRVRQQPVTNMIGFMTRFVGSFVKGQAIVASGCLGRLQRVTGSIYVSQRFSRGRGWRYDRGVSGGGVLLGQGVHLLDLLTWYFGPLSRVNAETFSVYSPDIEDFAHVMLEFQSGLRGWVDSSWSVRGKRTLETTIDVVGDNGSLFVNDDTVRLSLDRSATEYAAGQMQWCAADLFTPVPIDVAGPQYTREDQSFLHALQTNSLAVPNVEQAYYVQQIIDAAYASSAQSGAPQKVTGQ